MIPALIMGGLAAGGSLLSSFGASQAAKSQQRRQAAENLVAERKNEMAIYLNNEARRQMGQELLTIPEHESVHEINNFDPARFLYYAEQAGLNPATFAQMGGLSLASNRQTIRNTTGMNAADAYKLMMPERQEFAPNQAANTGSAMGALGGALSAGVSAFGTQYRADQSFDLQMQRMLMQSSGQGFGLSQNGYQTAVNYGGTGGTVAGRAASSLTGGLSRGGAKKDDDAFWPAYENPVANMWELKKPETTNPFHKDMGLNWTIPPGFANAEAYEDAGAEVWSWPYSIWKGANTIAWNTYGQTIPQIFRNAQKEVQDYKQTFTGDVKPYVPSGMPASIAYPAWARP